MWISVPSRFLVTRGLMAVRTNPLRRVAHALIRTYQLTFSSLLAGIALSATCSDYADEATAGHGLWAGG